MVLDRERFESPGTEHRGVPFWVWNDAVEQRHLDEQIEAMDRGGWGGFFVHPRVGLDVEFLSEEWLERVARSVETADDLGLESWLYDEDRWPSGSGAGNVPARGPEYRVKYLGLKPEPAPDDDVLVTLEYDGELHYACVTIPDAEELSVSKITNNGYADLLNPHAVEEFLRNTYEVYEDAVGEHFGDTIPGVFTDEPQLFRGASLDGDLIGYVPWTVGMPTLFAEEYGYDLLKHVGCLFIDEDAPDRSYEAVRYDFWRLVTERFVGTYSERLGEWCGRRGLDLTGHYLHEDSLQQQIRAVGAAMPHYVHQGVPGMDHLGRNVENPLTAKQVASVARQFDRPALSELYGGSGQNLSFEDRKWIGDWHLAHDVTRLNHHLSLYSMRGERKRDFPPNLFYQQPWWEYNDRIADYVARTAVALKRGEPAADVLVLHPIGTGWLEYASSSASDGEEAVAALNDRFCGLIDELLAAHVLIDLGDESILDSHGDAAGDELCVGEASYGTVVIPYCRTLRASTVDLLAAFADAGGDVLVVGDPPTMVDGRPADGRLDDLLGASEPVNAAEIPAAVDRPVRLRGGDGRETAPETLVHARETDDGLVAFVANTSREATQDGTLELEGTGRLKQWDPLEGTSEAVAAGERDGRTVADLTLPPAGSALLTLENGAPPATEGTSLSPSELRGETIDLSENDWRPVREDPNQAVLDTCDLVLDGERYEGTNVAAHWSDVTAVDDPEEWVPFTARYSFDVDESVVGDRLEIVVESADDQEVSVNGTELRSTDARWRDIHWHRFNVTDLVEAGKNEVVLRGTRSTTVSVEPVYVLGAFGVDVGSGAADHRICPEPATVSPEDITGQGYPFFTGTITLETEVDLDGPQEGHLAFDDLGGALAAVRVDDGEDRELYWRPWRVPVSLSAGTNRLRVTVITSLRNLTGPHHVDREFHDHGRESGFVSPATFRHPDNLGSVSSRAGAEEWTEGYDVVPVGIENPRLVL